MHGLIFNNSASATRAGSCQEKSPLQRTMWTCAETIRRRDSISKTAAQAGSQAAVPIQRLEYIKSSAELLNFFAERYRNGAPGSTSDLIRRLPRRRHLRLVILFVSYLAAISSSMLSPISAAILRVKEGEISLPLWSGTVVCRPSECFICRCEPLWRTCSNPRLFKILITSLAVNTGYLGIKRRGFEFQRTHSLDVVRHPPEAWRSPP